MERENVEVNKDTLPKDKNYSGYTAIGIVEDYTNEEGQREVGVRTIGTMSPKQSLLLIGLVWTGAATVAITAGNLVALGVSKVKDKIKAKKAKKEENESK